MSTVNAILRYVRRGRVLTVARIKGIEAEAIEFSVTSRSGMVGVPLKALGFPKGGIIGIIIRKEEIIIPGGEDIVEPGDDVIVFALPEAIPEIETHFA